MKFHIENILVPSFLVLSGCLPISQEVIIAPAVKGQILKSGIGVSKLRVAYSLYEDTSCTNPIETTLTNEEGKFHFTSKKETENYMILLPEDSYRQWNLCFSGSGGITGGWSGTSTGPKNAPASFNINCEVTKAPKDWCHRS